MASSFKICIHYVYKKIEKTFIFVLLRAYDVFSMYV